MTCKKLIISSITLFAIIVGSFLLIPIIDQNIVEHKLHDNAILVSKKVLFILPYTQKNDLNLKLFACQYLCSLAVRSPIDTAIPHLTGITKDDKLRNPTPPTVMSEKCHFKPSSFFKNDTSYHIFKTASHAIYLNSCRNKYENYLLNSKGNFNKRVVENYLFSFSEDYHSAALHEFRRIPNEIRYKLIRQSTIDYKTHLLVNDIIVNHQNYSSIYTLNIFRNDIITDIRNHLFKWSNFDSSYKYHLRYLISIKDAQTIKYAVTLLSDTSKISEFINDSNKKPDINDILNDNFTKITRYKVKTMAYNFLASIYHLPRAKDIYSTDCFCDIFLILWEDILKEELKESK